MVMSKPVSTALIFGGGCSLSWLMGSLLPFLFFGGNWGMVWFFLHLPLSEVVEDKFGIGTGSYLAIGCVTLVYAAVMGLVTGGLAWVYRWLLP